MVKAILYTDEQLLFVKANCTLPRKDLTALFNQTFKTSLKVDHISGLCKRKNWRTGRTGCFAKGNIPANKGSKGLTGPNKGSFKKGQLPFNQKKLGYEYIDSKDGYIHIKVAEPNVFKLKHRVVWEQHHGEVPSNYVIAFKNRDKTDCSIDNLMLMTRAEMVRYNQLYSKDASPETNETYLLMAKVKSRFHEVKNNASSQATN